MTTTSELKHSSEKQNINIGDLFISKEEDVVIMITKHLTRTKEENDFKSSLPLPYSEDETNWITGVIIHSKKTNMNVGTHGEFELKNFELLKGYICLYSK